MKIASYEASILLVPEDDPLANMPEEAGRSGHRHLRLRPIPASKASASRSMAAR